ncbi:MAG TPA: AMP-binding protein [Opitutales bacterium]|nr:AMP-binding protein [Opitutales bacterium]
MDCSVAAFRERFARPWMLGDGAGSVQAVFEDSLGRFQPGQRVLVMDADPALFWGKFLAAVAQRATVFLGLHAWSETFLDEAHRSMQGPVEADLAGFILIPTGGSGGQLRWAYHSWSSLRAAVLGLARGLGVRELSSMAALPFGHVSGLMPGLRAWITEGLYAPLDNKALEAGVVPLGAPGMRWQLSLVPTQLARWMESPSLVDWLRALDFVWIGGARLPQDLAQRARALRIPLAPCYGMTETAAMVLIQKPCDFLEGRADWSTPLPHGHLIVQGSAGDWCRVGLSFESLFEGYFPHPPCAQEIFWTQDELWMDADYKLSEIRRADRIIITGGEKVDPQMVEEALMASGSVRDVFVTGEAHPQWGQQVVAYWVPRIGVAVDEGGLRAFLRARLSAYQCPKRWICVERIEPQTGRKQVYRDLS